MREHRGFFVVLVFFFALFLSATEGHSSTITATAEAGGTISPAGAVTVTDGDDQTFTITPDPGFGVSDVMVDSVSVGRVLSYTFTNVTADHSITASFFDCDLFPVMLDWDESLYGTIMEAYDFATIDLGLNNFSLMLRDGIFFEFLEDLIFDADASVILDGGYDCSFLDNSFLTRISGSLTIAAGTVIPSNILLSAPLPCDGTDPNNLPGNPEICDGLDNNCNTVVDDGLGTDADGDGHYTTDSCFTFTPANDCDDNDPNNFPGNPEVCDGLDNNCDTQVDEGLPAVDADGDGYSAIGSCGGTADDCNDNDPNINPGATELLGDGIDQDCDRIDVLPSEQVCFTCHDVFLTDQIHARVAAPDTSCIPCHSERESSVRSGHYGETVRTPGNNMSAGEIIRCVSCHDAHDPEFYTIPGDFIVWAKVHADGRLNVTCYTCHETLDVDHETGNAHDNRLIDPSCGACHTSDTTSLGSPGTGTLETDEDVFALHRSDCLLCHAYTGTKIDPAIIEQVILAGLYGIPVTCTDCHLDKTTAHGNIDHVAFGYVTVGATSCAGCHDPGGAANATVAVTHNDNCGLCHTIIPNLQQGIPAGGGNCTTCHGADFTTVHPDTVDHISIVTVGSLLCANCHSNPPPLVEPTDPMVHNACTSCHDTNGGLISLAIGKSFAVGGDCAACHDYATYSEGHGCTGCHGEPPTESTLGGPNGLIGSPSAPTGYSSAGAHAIHAGSSGYNFPCEYCHQGGMSETNLVLNDQLDIDFDTSPFEIDNVDPSLGLTFQNFDPTTQNFDGMPLNQPYQYSTGNTTGGSNTCANTYCHSDGTAVATRLFDDQIPANTSPSWEGTTTCESCHGYAPDYPSLSPKTNAHERHIGLFYQGGINEDANPCHVCHYSTTLNGSTISNKSNHVNGQYDVAANPNIVFKQNLQPANQYPVSFTYNYDPRNSSCSNISCHTNLIATDHTWGYGTIPPEPPTPTGWYPEATIISGNAVEVTVPGAPFGKIYVYWGGNQGNSSFTSGNSVQHTYPNGTYEISVLVYDLDHNQHWYYWDSWPAEQSCDTCPSLNITVP